jgi:hypothetical protein
MLADSLEESVAICARHADVAHDDVEALLREQLERARSARRAHNREVARDDSPKQRTASRIVVPRTTLTVSFQPWLVSGFPSGPTIWKNIPWRWNG